LVGFDVEINNGTKNLLCKITVSARCQCNLQQQLRVVSTGNSISISKTNLNT